MKKLMLHLFIVILLTSLAISCAPVDKRISNNNKVNWRLTKLLSLSQKYELLYVINAKDGQLIKNANGDYVLVLQKPFHNVVYFTDRPQRISSTISLKDFMKFWKMGDKAFANNPPNAYLQIYHSQKLHLPFDDVVVLHEPTYDAINHKLFLLVKPIGANKNIKTPLNFNEIAVFVS